ncbi:MAG: cytochrome P450 [Myxococcota bacterium]
MQPNTVTTRAAHHGGRATLRRTPLSDAVDLPKLPLRDVRGLPGEGGRHQVRDTVEQLRDMHGFMQRRRARFGPNFTHGYFGFVPFAVGEPELARELLLDRDKVYSSRMGWDFSIGELFEGGLMLRDFDDHRAQRNIMQAAFRPVAMRGYLDIINPIIDDALENRQGTTTYRFYPTAKQLGLRIAAELLLGVSLEQKQGRRISRAFVNAVNAAVAIVRRPVPPLQYWQGMRGRQFLRKYFLSQIDERRRSERGDMFSQLCRATDDQGERLTDEEIAHHMIFLVLAAHDTTASAVTTSVWALATHPYWQDRVREEVLTTGDRYMPYDARDALPQTGWVFKEAIRMQPPVPFMMRRAVRDTQLGPYALPKNLAVGTTSLITHYLPDWWTDPTRFDPLRFSPERAEHRKHPGLYYPFGAGAHMCLGVHLATMQAKAFLYQFVRRHQVTLESSKATRFRTIPIPHPVGGLPIRVSRPGSRS